MGFGKEAEEGLFNDWIKILERKKNDTWKKMTFFIIILFSLEGNILV